MEHTAACWLSAVATIFELFLFYNVKPLIIQSHKNHRTHYLLQSLCDCLTLTADFGQLRCASQPLRFQQRRWVTVLTRTNVTVGESRPPSIHRGETLMAVKDESWQSNSRRWQPEAWQRSHLQFYIRNTEGQCNTWVVTTATLDNKGSTSLFGASGCTARVLLISWP